MDFLQTVPEVEQQPFHVTGPYRAFEDLAPIPDIPDGYRFYLFYCIGVVTHVPMRQRMPDILDEIMIGYAAALVYLVTDIYWWRPGSKIHDEGWIKAPRNVFTNWVIS
ncbi:hypothetical protein NO263_06260 [Gluconacetobacter entanii]|uniref:Uncharacterized protein n=1 Tax=Gluconacetobacter entanii TaxID=108528 RepID=A0ABT3K434_9PROT|nr:hypothetical protein [Gluconacetobacter entanii]MCW4590180.1 hypothetical protein [Gluconacetobacter entanii]MCW4593713.1 hypothetical protein [Gluconacetobacter entanii]NPC87887.1 hypothetical protein [Gluconacetobacter entanii]